MHIPLHCGTWNGPAWPLSCSSTRAACARPNAAARATHCCTVGMSMTIWLCVWSSNEPNTGACGEMAVAAPYTQHVLFHATVHCNADYFGHLKQLADCGEELHRTKKRTANELTKKRARKTTAQPATRTSSSHSRPSNACFFAKRKIMQPPSGNVLANKNQNVHDHKHNRHLPHWLETVSKQNQTSAAMEIFRSMQVSIMAAERYNKNQTSRNKYLQNPSTVANDPKGMR